MENEAQDTKVVFYDSIDKAHVGDYAFIEGRYDNTRVVIRKITPTGRIEVEGVINPKLTWKFDSKGKEIGNTDRWHYNTLLPYSEEIYNAWRENNVKNNTSRFLSEVNWKELAGKDLVEIVNLVKSKLPTQPKKED